MNIFKIFINAFNCSQTKFDFLVRFFCLTNFFGTSNFFGTFRPPKQDKKYRPEGINALRALQLTSLQVCISQRVAWRPRLMGGS